MEKHSEITFKGKVATKPEPNNEKIVAGDYHHKHGPRILPVSLGSLFVGILRAARLCADPALSCCQRIPGRVPRRPHTWRARMLSLLLLFLSRAHFYTSSTDHTRPLMWSGGLEIPGLSFSQRTGESGENGLWKSACILTPASVYPFSSSLDSFRAQARREETREEVLQGALSGHRQRRVYQLPHDIPLDRDPQAQLFLW